MSRNYRGGTGFARPENALKRADELENVGQKMSALQALHDIITSKKHRTWSKTYESIMFKLIDLCVELRKRNHAKEALMQYRNMCQQVNINSLEEVIKYFLKTAGDKAEEAQTKADAVTIDVVDLEEDASPEEIMLSYVSGEKSKDRTDRELVTPWFRFLWETYRSVLEILRTNPKLEPLYAMTANKAFQFCLQYKRTAEFRRLCDILRQHLANIAKYRDQRDITQPESLQLHMETRFEQLKVACELELWAEAFRSVEDIQGLIVLGKKSPKQQMMAIYYARLTQIFSKSEAHLYLAYAWLKLFNFSKSYNKNLTQSDLQMMACSVLLSTLSILPYERNDSRTEEASEQEKERLHRMANILGFQVDSKRDFRNILSRAALLASINAQGIISLVPPEVKAVYDLLTTDFNPLELCQKLQPQLNVVAEVSNHMSSASPVKDLSLAQYDTPLKTAAILRLMRQLSEVYSSMKISSLEALVPFATFGEVEAVIADAVKYDYLQVQIDHRNGTLHFGGQQLESDKVRNHLAVLTKRLTKALGMMGPAVSAEREARRAIAIQHCMDNIDQEHKRAIARKIVIEKRKEEQELALLEQEREEERRRVQAAREQELMEERRRREEMERRERDRITRELEEIERVEMMRLIDTQKNKLAKFKPGDKLDKKTLMEEAISNRMKSQAELERKLARHAKQLDHLERARREEEVPYLEAAYRARLEEDKRFFEEQQALFLESHRKAWEVDVAQKQRLSAMMPEKEKFQAMIMERREEEFAALQHARRDRIVERAARRRHERLLARRRAFVQRCKDEVAAKIAELEEEQRREEEEQRRAQVAERQRKLEEMAQKQREREEELERRLAEQRDRDRAPPPREREPPTRAPPAAAAPAASQGRSGGGGFGGSGYVPPHLRKQVQAADGGAPPAKEEAARGAPAKDERRPVREDAREPPADNDWRSRELPREERPGWSRDREAAPKEEGDKWGGSRGQGSYQPPSARGDRPGPVPYVPPRRDGPSDDGAARDGPRDGPRDAPRRPQEEARSGSYRPPASRW